MLSRRVSAPLNVHKVQRDILKQSRQKNILVPSGEVMLHSNTTQ